MIPVSIAGSVLKDWGKWDIPIYQNSEDTPQISRLTDALAFQEIIIPVIGSSPLMISCLYDILIFKQKMAIQ